MGKLENKWTDDKIKLVLPPISLGFMKKSGLFYMNLVLDEKVGNEVVLIIFDDTDFVYEMRDLKPFQFYVNSVSITTSYGPIISFLFYVTNPADESVIFSAYDKPIDITNEELIKHWVELSNQTHIHLLIVDRRKEVVGFFEFENNFKIEKSIERIYGINRSSMINFDRALEEYFNDYDLKGLVDLARKNGEKKSEPSKDNKTLSPEDAKELIKQFLANKIVGNAYSFTELPSKNWNIYSLPKNCYYMSFSNSILDNSGILQSSVVIAIDKQTGKIRYCGSANDEG